MSTDYERVDLLLAQILEMHQKFAAIPMVDGGDVYYCPVCYGIGDIAYSESTPDTVKHRENCQVEKSKQFLINQSSVIVRMSCPKCRSMQTMRFGISNVCPNCHSINIIYDE